MYLGPCHTSNGALLLYDNNCKLKVVNYFYKKSSIADIWQGSKPKKTKDIMLTQKACYVVCLIYLMPLS